MTKQEAVKAFKTFVLPAIKREFEKNGRCDRPARDQAWNDWTDTLQKNGHITRVQYNGWTTTASICKW